MPIGKAVKGFFKGFQGGYTSSAANRKAKETLEKALSKSAIPATAAGKNEGSGIGCLLLLILFAVGGYALWDAVDQYGYIPHNKLAIVTAKNWSIGEYKNCTSPNISATQDEPQIDCSSYSELGESKKFEVRFYGKTFREDLKNVSFSWRCKKNDGADPTFTCDEQKVFKWDEKN
jgi:hypothetical protein